MRILKVATIIIKEVSLNSGIYCIENIVNHKKYIGQSKNVKTRIKSHIWVLNNKKHVNDLLQKDWDEYGESNFAFTILEYCEEENLIERESYYINLLNSRFDQNGYNIMTEGKGNRYDIPLKIPIELKSKSIFQLSKDKSVFKIWDNGLKQLSENTDYNLLSIYYCCIDNPKYKSYKGFYWVFSEKYEKFLSKNTNVHSGSPIILQYTLRGEFIKEWENASVAASKNNTTPSSIYKCCRQETKSCANYIWSYKDNNYVSKEYVEKLRKRSDEMLLFDINDNLVERSSVCSIICDKANIDIKTLFKVLSKEQDLRDYKIFYA